jgi:hypothetical protein
MMSMWKVIKDKKVHDFENTWSLYRIFQWKSIDWLGEQPLPVPELEKTKPSQSKYPNPWSPHNMRGGGQHDSNQEMMYAPNSPLEFARKGGQHDLDDVSKNL